MPYIPNSDTTQLTCSVTEGAIAADQQQVEPRPILVGPTTADEFNTIGERLIPKSCFRFEDVTFEYDSSFVLPRVETDMESLANLRDKHTLTLPGSPEKKIPPPLSIFGHADPVGYDDYNKKLSGRRAQAIYGMLVRDEDLWDDLFRHPLGRDNWGDAAIQTMFDEVSASPKSQDEATETQSQDRVKAFQSEKQLVVDGIVGPETRKALYRAYMNALCGPRLELDKKEDFLGHNKDKQGKGDYQGCSEFNPVLMFSQEKNAEYEQAKDKTERNQENQPNRRVMVLLFAPGRRVNPQLWPCPRVKEGVSDCKKRFFLDAPRRRSFQEKRREFADTKDTFACRFYQLITDDSPCERGSLAIHVFIGLHRPFFDPIPDLARITFAPNEGMVEEFALTEGIDRGDGFLHFRVSNPRPGILYTATVRLSDAEKPVILFRDFELHKLTTGRDGIASVESSPLGCDGLVFKAEDADDPSQVVTGGPGEVTPDQLAAFDERAGSVALV